MRADPDPSSLAKDAPAASDTFGEANDGLMTLPAELAYPFLDALGPRLDEFGSSDEGFRAYLETQLSQYGFPEF